MNPAKKKNTIESSQRAKRRPANGADTQVVRKKMDLSKVRAVPTKRQLQRLTKPTADQIDTSETPELGPEFWQHAERNPHVRFTKQQVTVRLDAKVLDWLKKGGRGYQTRLNDVLRKAMLKDMAKDHRKAS